jgi:heavy metal translocating P-type ATPase
MAVDMHYTDVVATCVPDLRATRSITVRRAHAAGENWIVLLSAAGIVIHLCLRFLVHLGSELSNIPLYVAIALGGAPLLWGLTRRLWRREFGSDLLAGLSILTAVLTGQYLVATIIVLMLSGGTALESYATERAKSVLSALGKRTPTIAHRKTDAGPSDISVDQIGIGDTLVILPHEIAPVDGTVLEGRGRMDESFLTGEPFEISKTSGSPVLSGALNGEEALVMVASKFPAESRHAKILEALQQAETNRPYLRRLGDTLGAWYTPFAVAIALGAWLVSGDPLRFLAVIVIATPCPMLIAIPVAILGAISLAAKRGIIVRNPASLERIDGCRTLIFDKTGTLTYGRPVLTEATCVNGFSRAEVLGKAASLEQYSKHPLASAILAAAREEGVPVDAVSSISEKPGAGLRGIVNGVTVWITGRSQASIADLPPAVTGLECLVIFDQRLAGILHFRDEPRRESLSFISHLTSRHRVKHIMLLSGDREEEVRHLAGRVGITEVHFSKTPEEKVAIVTAARERDTTLFVGDGINDAPAMLVATAGVALGSANDITAQAADAVVLDSSLEKVDELLHISRRMRRIALESAVGGMVLSIAGMLLAATGWLSPIVGAVAQEAIDVAALVNALRVSFYRRRLADF